MWNDTIDNKIKAILNSSNFKNDLIQIWEDYHHYTCDLVNPQTYNNHLLKRFFEMDQSTILKYVDKISFKQEMINLGFSKYINKNIAVFQTVDKLRNFNFEKLHYPVIFKFNNTTEGNDLFVVSDVSKLYQLLPTIIDKFNNLIEKFKNHQIKSFDDLWCYGQIEPILFVEKFLSNDNVYAKDYKIFAFNSNQNAILIQDYQQVFNSQFDWNKLDIVLDDIKNINDPDIKHMNKIATKILKILNLSHVRVDFYLYKKKIYIGEITFLTSNSFFSFYKKTNYDKQDLDWSQRILKTK